MNNQKILNTAFTIACQTGAMLREAPGSAKQIERKAQHSGPITGTHGVWLRPDFNLADIEPSLNHNSPRILILLRPHECTMKLLFSPRVHS
jgi:hypothetical protein